MPQGQRDPRLLTGCYANFSPALGAPVRITVDRPWRLPYQLAGELRELAPYGLGRIKSVEAFDRLYVARLERFGVERLRRGFEQIAAAHGEPLVLLCFKAPGEHCHRRTFAAWWEQRAGQRVPEATYQPQGWACETLPGAPHHAPQGLLWPRGLSLRAHASTRPKLSGTGR